MWTNRTFGLADSRYLATSVIVRSLDQRPHQPPGACETSSGRCSVGAAKVPIASGLRPSTETTTTFRVMRASGAWTDTGIASDRIYLGLHAPATVTMTTATEIAASNRDTAAGAVESFSMNTF